MTNAFTTMREHPSAVLLVGQLVAVLAYPFLDGSTAGRAGIGVLQLLLLVVAVAAVRLTPALSWVAILFGAPATIFAVWEAVAPNEGWVVLVSALFHVPFYLFVSYAMIRYLFHDDVVTRDELYATGAAFTVVAWAFAYLFAAVQVIWPDSFDTQRSWFELLYLSFTTLTSLGLSDIVPVQPHARSVVMVEQVAGVFYVALVVARLVGLARPGGR
ncbi:ion channel [Nocardioides sp. NPDC051685]|uniref:ion channel n=1 Tax=Nocardioides sp. NPDC051685 TaxID=3364334 RepID=UPI0037AAAFEE